MRRFYIPLVAAGLLSAGCPAGRFTSLQVHWKVPNRITGPGFNYVKRGVEISYKVPGRQSVPRRRLAQDLDVAQSVYRRLVAAAGGLTVHQRLVNVVIEVTKVAGSFRVHAYADVVQFGRAPCPPAGYSKRARR